MSMHEQVFNLRRNAFVSLRGLAPGRRLVCREGLLWITYDAQALDILLEPDQGHVLRYSGAAVQALAPSRLLIAPAAAASRPRAWLFASLLQSD